MSSANKTIIAFDLYGTLLSTESISIQLATHFGDEKAKRIAALWRRYQLEYTWRMDSMGVYKPFYNITLASLQHALAETSSALPHARIADLMQAYDSLSTFPDVVPALEALARDPSIDAYVFSNGTDSMVQTSVERSPSLSPHSNVFKSLITVEAVGVFKPDPKVYEYLTRVVGKRLQDRSEVWLVTGNPFDVVGARVAGLSAVWVDRAGQGWVDGLGELVDGCPTVIVRGVDEALTAIKKCSAENGGGAS